VALVAASSVSVDGFIAGPDGDMSWLTPYLTDDPNPLVDGLVARTGAVLSGARSHFGDDPHAGDPEHEGLYAGVWHGPEVVLTHRRPSGTVAGDVTYVDDLATAVDLARRAAGDLDVSVVGASLTGQLLAAGLLDELMVNWVPVVLGGGTPLLPEGPGARLDQIATYVGGGSVTARYRPRRD
jgi:dihydrofolate reductase